MKQDQLVTRESIMKLLSDEEVGRVATAETLLQLEPGAEYLDLTHLERGVQRTRAHFGPLGTIAMAKVLPKNALDEPTWTKILAQLPARPA